MKKHLVLNTYINETTIDEVANRLINESKLTVAVCNANSLVRASKSIEINDVLNNFDICTPDGFPVALASKLLYKNNQRRVDGFNLFNKTLEISENKDVTHYFFGNKEEVVQKIIKKFQISNPDTKIVGYVCPPIKEVEDLLNDDYVQEILKIQPSIVWVSLGFPKQELFINKLKNKYEINSNLVGIGFTFDWVSGAKFKAPEILANIGMEWIFRLVQEPRRLFKRYLIDNCLFILYFIKQYKNK
jgi:N-acetylglucosaminyldiphosphoundecaprenol N-acetyl-beta-D-mannosaminyltransferase|tara:strand:- start:4102 stop:4836 length:735 start_codon:yes stop_codon:yes gene_type:complete